MTIRHESRPDCAAAAHDTLWAYTRHRCRCTAAVAAKDRARGPRPARRPVDPDRVQAAVRGERVRLSVHERRAAIAALADRPAVHVAEVLQLGVSTIYLHRQTATTNTQTKEAA